MHILGHRGAKGLAPENTLVAIKTAAEVNAIGIEIDAQLSRDQIPVIFHDPTLTRCTNFDTSDYNTNRLCDFDLPALKKLDAGSYFNSAFKGETIPTLEEALIACREHNLDLNLEIKTHDFNSKEDIKKEVKKVIEVLKHTKFEHERLVLSSFSIPAVEYCLEFAPHIRRGMISYELFDLKAMKRLSLYSVHMGYEKLTKEFCEQAKALGLIIYIWTLNDPSLQASFKTWGVDNIITDYPDKFL